jgi:hypothetical protein
MVHAGIWTNTHVDVHQTLCLPWHFVNVQYPTVPSGYDDIGYYDIFEYYDA